MAPFCQALEQTSLSLVPYVVLPATCNTRLLLLLCLQALPKAPVLCLQGSLFPMCGMNLAFNRELIGPAMYFGLMGEGYPIGRYDDMWAGWCVKVHILSMWNILISLPVV